MFRPLTVTIGVAAFLLVTKAAAADDTHYRGVPIGAHAAGLGGAFTGVADDPSAAYFNPAGLTLRGTVGLAASLTINTWERFDLDRAFAQPEVTAKLTTQAARTVPVFVGAALSFGPTDVYDRKRFAVALSVLDPIFSRGGVRLTLQSDSLASTDSYTYSTDDRATWYGVSFASRINREQSIGASLFLSTRRLQHSEVGLALGDGTPLPSEPGVLFGASTAANSQSLGFRAFHFILRFGWLYRIKPQVQLGVMLQLPGIPLRQTVNAFSQGFVNDNRDTATPLATEAYFVDRKFNANLPIPAELSAGLEYWPAEKVMLALNGWFYAPVRSGLRVEVPEPVPIGGLFFDADTARSATGNVAVAGEFSITRRVSIQTGFFTDLSSAVKIPENPDRYYNPRIQRLGATLSLGLNIAGVALALGSTFIYGKGDATGVVVDANNQPLDYTRTQATSRIVYLHLTGAAGAASGLGDKAGVKRSREREQREAEEAEQRRRDAQENGLAGGGANEPAPSRDGGESSSGW